MEKKIINLKRAPKRANIIIKDKRNAAKYVYKWISKMEYSHKENIEYIQIHINIYLKQNKHLLNNNNNKLTDFTIKIEKLNRASGSALS